MLSCAGDIHIMSEPDSKFSSCGFSQCRACIGVQASCLSFERANVGLQLNYTFIVQLKLMFNGVERALWTCLCDFANFGLVLNVCTGSHTHFLICCFNTVSCCRQESLHCWSSRWSGIIHHQLLTCKQTLDRTSTLEALTNLLCSFCNLMWLACKFELSDQGSTSSDLL